MSISKKLLVVLLAMSTTVFAGEKGSIGFSAEVSVSGFFSPELTEVKVNEVFVDSPAEEAGIVVGDKIVAIDGCTIPGCSATKGKKLMAKAPGEKLPLLVEKADGSQISIIIDVR